MEVAAPGRNKETGVIENEVYGSDAYQPGPGPFTATSTALQTHANPD